MSARRWWLALAAIPALILVGAFASAVFVVAQRGWVGLWEVPFMPSGVGRGLGGAVLIGIFVCQPLASAWLLVHVVPGRRPRMLPGLCALSGVVVAVVYAWGILVLWVRQPAEPAFLIALAGTVLSLPICLAGLICCYHMRDPEKVWFFRPLARVFFAAAVFLGVLQIGLPLDSALYRWNVDKAKAFVESVAQEVQRESRAMGTPPEEIDGLLLQLDRRPLWVLHAGLEYTRKEDGFLLEFRSSPGMMHDDFWTYHVPSGEWRYRRQ